MNDRQKAMYDFVVERAQAEKKAELEALLLENFRMQDEVEKINDKVKEFMTAEGVAQFDEWRDERRKAREQRMRAALLAETQQS